MKKINLSFRDKLFLAIFFVLVFILISNYLYQAIYKIPVIIQPIEGDTVNPSLLRVDYNQIDKKDKTYYKIEIYKDKQFERDEREGWCMKDCTFYTRFDDKQKYYIRSRSITDNQPNWWSKARYFYTSKNNPIYFIKEFE